MRTEVVPLQEQHFEGLLRALDIVAREKRFLALQVAPPREEAFAFYRSFLEHARPHFVALVDGIVVGWCDVQSTFGESRAHVGILGIALVPTARCKGLGTALMRAAIEASWRKGLTRIELTVRADNATAKALYERMGFVVEGLNRRAFCVGGEYCDSYSMGLIRP
jgi:putative acetyltransferase